MVCQNAAEPNSNTCAKSQKVYYNLKYGTFFLSLLTFDYLIWFDYVKNTLENYNKHKFQWMVLLPRLGIDPVNLWNYHWRFYSRCWYIFGVK